MLYVQSPEESQISMFKIMVENVIEGKKEYQAFVDEIILETISFSQQKTDIYSVNSDNLFVVLYLSTVLSQFFIDYNNHIISMDCYRKVKDVLSPVEASHA